MTFGVRPCSCGGENENCFRCFGTGLFTPGKDAGERIPGTYRAQRSGGMSAPTSTKNLRKCPECGQMVRRMDRHIRRVHRTLESDVAVLVALKRKPVKAPVPVVAKAARPLHRCPDCGAMVKSLEKHRKKARHAKRIAAGGAPSRPAKPKRASALACPACKFVAPSLTQLQSHIFGCHGRRAFAQFQTFLASQPRSAGSGPRSNAPVVSDDDRERRMDASYGAGGSFRDYGQFGSHPGYDGMDDESSP
jgi:predicted RNA-binding Zn-ribbon protein involved in translation (DUF1610 family)